MKKRITSFAFVLFFNLISVSILQGQVDTLWTKTFGGSDDDGSYSIQQTTDGGYIISGTTYSFGTGNFDVWLIKTDAIGDTLWTRTFGGNDSDGGYSIRQTFDSGYIIVGETGSFGDLFGDVYLIKTDSSGNALWTKTFGIGNTDVGRSIQQTTDSGYVIAGYTRSFGSGNYDVWLIKTDALGDTLWTRTFGGNDFDAGYSVQQTTDGGYIIVGETESFGAGLRDVWLIKTNSSGDTLWTKTFGGNSLDLGNYVLETNDGGFIIAGQTSSFNAFIADVYLIKTDTSGNALWTQIIDGGSDDWGYSIQHTIDGGYIILGGRSNDVWLIKTDAFGDTLWTKTFGGINSDWGGSVRQTTDRGYIITGYTESFGAGGADVWLIKTTPEITDVEQDSDEIISDFSLKQNYPNPFNPSTTIKFSMPSSSYTTLKIFNALGEEVAVLLDKELASGTYEVDWDATDVPSGVSAEGGYASGVYFYQLKTESYIETKKMILMK